MRTEERNRVTSTHPSLYRLAENVGAPPPVPGSHDGASQTEPDQPGAQILHTGAPPEVMETYYIESNEQSQRKINFGVARQN